MSVGRQITVRENAQIVLRLLCLQHDRTGYWRVYCPKGQRPSDQSSSLYELASNSIITINEMKPGKTLTSQFICPQDSQEVV